MDYLERDSRSAGVTYGLYDRERILKSYLVYKGLPKQYKGLPKQEGNNEEDYYRLGIKRSGLRAVENFMQARFELFVQVYFHKTNRAAQLMIEEAATAIGEESLLDTTDVDIDEFYLGLTDRRFMRALQGKSQKYDISKVSGSEKVKSIAKNLSNRNIWKRIYEGGEDEVGNVMENLNSKDNLRIDDVFAEPGKDIERGIRLLVRNEDNKYHTNLENIWYEESPIMKGLVKHAQSIYRIYYEGFEDKEKEKMRNKAR